MDVKTIFLSGHLNKEINMCQPEDFVKSGDEQKVCKLFEINIWSGISF